MKKPISKLILAIASAGILGAATGGAIADPVVETNHPRIDQVNDRLHNENQRIKKEVREGDLSKKEARHLHRKLKRIHHKERVMAKHNGGHITKAQQRSLNHQENAVSRRIGE